MDMLYNKGMGVLTEGIPIYHEGWYSGILYLTSQFVPDEKPQNIGMSDEVEEEEEIEADEVEELEEDGV